MIRPSLAIAMVIPLALALGSSAMAKTMHLPAGTIVLLRPVVPIGTESRAVALQVERDVTIGGRLVFARGALARGTVPARGPAAPGGRRVAIDWIFDTSGDKVSTTGALLPPNVPLAATIREQDVTVPDSYDPSVR